MPATGVKINQSGFTWLIEKYNKNLQPTGTLLLLKTCRERM